MKTKPGIVFIGMCRQVTYLLPHFFYKDSFFLELKGACQLIMIILFFWYMINPVKPKGSTLVWLYVFIFIELLRLVNFISIFHISYYNTCLMIASTGIFISGLIFLIKGHETTKGRDNIRGT